MKRKLYLMRHGQTLFNKRRKVQGWCDAPLTELGIEQAEITAEYFKKSGIFFDEAYSSTSERASDTLELITDIPYKRLKGLKEWNFGTFEGESEDLNPPLPYKDFFANYGGEEEKAFQKRAVETCIDFMENGTGEAILAVSHGAFCGQFRKYWDYNCDSLHKIENNKGRIGNCCIFIYEYENKEFKLTDVINGEEQLSKISEK